MQDTALNAERAAQVLSLVVQHCNHLLALKDVCALLQTNSTVRHALQQLRLGRMVVLPFGPLPVKYGKTTVEDVQRLAARRETWLVSFTEWLPHHASLVAAFKYNCSFWEPHKEQQLALLLRLCRLQTAAEALPPLRLTSFHQGNVPASASLLRELACVNLQELHITAVDDGDTPSMPAFCAALQRLASLRRLTLTPLIEYELPEQHALADDCVVGAVAQLSHLTALDLGLVRRECVVRFPPSLQELQIDLTLTACGCEVVDLSHLTALTRLMLGRCADTIQELVLPPQLTSLDAARALPARFTGASGLQLVSAVVSSFRVPGERGFLECLLSLPSLVELNLGLNLGRSEMRDTLPLAASVLGTLTRLTSLALCTVEGSYYRGSPVVDVCGPVSQLTKLRSLELRRLPVCQEGILSLTALHSLTQLQLHEVGLDDVSAIALTMALTGLQHLHLAGDFNSRALMPAAAGLRALQHLFVRGLEVLNVGDRELLLLSGLTQLSHLTLARNKCTDDGKQRLLSHLRRLPAVLG